MSIISNSSKLKTLFGMVAALLALLLLAAGLTDFELLPGQPFPFSLLWGSGPAIGGAGPRPEVPASLVEFTVMLALFMLTLVLLLWIITFIIRPQARKRMLRRIIVYLALLLLIHGVLNLVEDLKLSNDQVGNPAFPAQSDLEDSIEPLPTPPAFVVQHPQWLVMAIAFVLMALVLGGVWFGFQRWPLSAPPPSEATRLDLFLQEAQQAIDHLNRGSNLKNSVLRCYQAMTHVLSEERGIYRERAMTPRDFELHLVDIGLQDEHIRRLTRLFEKVRYGAGPPVKAEEAEAIDCLSAIVRAYGKTV